MTKHDLPQTGCTTLLQYAPLFQRLKIGPVEIKNRFYQVPHCNGMNRQHPSAMARMRGIKAEGGWGAVCTEQTDVHYSSCHPRELRLWDSADLPILQRMVEEVHAHDALAGIELAHNGFHLHNLETRAIPIAPNGGPTRTLAPVHARAMDLQDIRDVRRWHRQAALNARAVGYDIVYIYAGHDMTLPAHFLSRRHNQRSDAYGGSLENRVRLLRELIEDAKDAVGDRCAVALRFGVDELKGSGGLSCTGEGRDVVEMLAELPDLWDVNLSDFGNDGQSSRYSEEGFQEDYVSFVKTVTTKPVVGVGRYTSVDRMLRLITSGRLDLIGAARPSIADPFLPEKIRTGAFDDIRECIGCNMCVASDKISVPLRCTQNPTMGEEWRRGWHPEIINSKDTNDRILIVGAGPAGLEAATWLGRRGYSTMIADRASDFGGRVLREAKLPGLRAWQRVADWRLSQIRKDPALTMLPENDLKAEDLVETDFSLIALATGATWRRDGTGRSHSTALLGLENCPVYTPDDLLSGQRPQGRVLVFDDDHYYMGGILTEYLAEGGAQPVYVTPESLVSAWTVNTAEQHRIQARTLELCAEVHLSSVLAAVQTGAAILRCAYTGRTEMTKVDGIVLVTAQDPNDALYDALSARPTMARLVRIGDCYAPGTIAAAVYSGHQFARTLDNRLTDAPPFRRETVTPDWSQPFPDPHNTRGPLNE